MYTKKLENILSKLAETKNDKPLLKFLKMYPTKNLISIIIELDEFVELFPEERTRVGNLFLQFITKGNINDDPLFLFKIVRAITNDKGYLDEHDDDEQYGAFLLNEIETLKELLNKAIDLGINLNIRNEDGYTVFFYCLMEREVSLLYPKISFTEASDIDMKDEYGNDALMFAVLNNNNDLVKKLLDLGFSPLIENDEGSTALSLAQEEVPEDDVFKNEDMINLMKNYMSQHLLDSDITTRRGELLHGDIINYEITDYL